LALLTSACEGETAPEAASAATGPGATGSQAQPAEAGADAKGPDATEAAARAALAAARGEGQAQAAPSREPTAEAPSDQGPTNFEQAAGQQEPPPGGKAARPAADQVLQANGEYAGRPMTERGQAQPQDYDTPPPNAPLYRAGCPKGTCKQDCPKGAICEFDCEGGKCIQNCVRGSDCLFTCDGGGCNQRAEARASVTMWCEGGGCAQVCESGPGCHRKCGDKCKGSMTAPK
jgi:hypothetical protein